ncbi:MAG: hypothetical protein NW226_00460 [Microscillaceae bacterium]|nr:hypothetical protein [Microscillaceae bacterium]
MRRVRFNEDSIEIRQYEFQTSSVRDTPFIKLEHINEVNLNTFPPSIVINHNEVIFIEARYKRDFIEFVRKNKLKVENRFDIWESINEEFLDTEFTEQHQERTFEQLKINGIEREEVIEIRDKIRELMSGWASVAWEWNYLGHYDLLLNKKQSFLLLFPKDFYWWTMEIALRNYKKSSALPD